MTADGPATLRNWQAVREEVLRRIQTRIWKPGDLIPNEADLALEFGCARTTVNRALRSVAETGLLDRRRKAGTRVALQPVARATFSIPILRHEIAERGLTYGYRLLTRQIAPPPPAIQSAMIVDADAPMLHVRALHLGDDAPYVIEDRWINLTVVPTAIDAPFTKISANEWLLNTAPYTHGDIALSSALATQEEARDLACPRGAALFVLARLTCHHDAAITKVRLAFAPGHVVRMAL